MKPRKNLPPLSILSLLFVSACGGGGGGSSSNQNQQITNNYSGAVVKGPLQNALVFLDYDNDGIFDVGNLQ